MSVEARNEYIPGDPILIRDIISHLKSQGVFDQFRKECISDVDTKPAYQNLCHRVDGQVSSYLSDIRWGPDLNKNQLRENIRKFVNECTFVEPGIARIVDQLVNPRINTVLVPKVEDIVYQYVGIPPVERNLPNENCRDPKENHIFDNQDSLIDKSGSSNLSQKRNNENGPSWLRSPSQKSDNYVQSKKDSSSNRPSLFDLKLEPPDEAKEKNEGSRIDLFHSEGGEDDDSRAYSTIDSDEGNLNDDVEEPSPSFEAFDKLDTCNSASIDSDYQIEVVSSKDDFQSNLKTDEKSTPSSVEPNNGSTTDLLDDRHSQSDVKVFEEIASTQLDLPKTPTINYETSEDSDYDNGLKMLDTANEVSVEQRHGSPVDDIPDFSNVDKIAQKIAEDNRELEKIVPGDDEVSSKTVSCDQPKNLIELNFKVKEEKTDKHQKDNEKDNFAKDSKHRDRKHSEHRKDKHKSDKRDSSRDDREHKHREKERSNHDSSKSKNSKSHTENREKIRKSSDEKDLVDDEVSNKSKNKEDHKSHKSHDDRKCRDKDDKKLKGILSGDKRSKDDKSKEKRSRSDDGKEDRKRSRHDSDRSKDVKKISQEDDKVKIKKSDGSESKKASKSQCGSDEKRARTDRRSSDRDSNGPSSSSNHSHHRSSSKSDKDKHSDKAKYSSSFSSTSTSHKSKKSDNIKDVSGVSHSQHGDETDSSKREHFHFEKKKEVKLSSSQTVSDHPDVNLKKQEDEQNSKFSSHLSSKKHSLVEMNSKVVTSIPNELPSNSNWLLKISENDLSIVNIKKPKIARNESEFSKVVRLRKEYKEKMRLLQQQGKENDHSKSCHENDERRIKERLSPMSTLEETTVAPVVPNGNKNGVIKELRLSITRIDSCYEIVNGSCYINYASVHNNQAFTAEESSTISDTDVKKLQLKTKSVCEEKPDKPSSDTDTKFQLKIKPICEEKPDKLFKLKICRSISPTSGKERTKCVQSSTNENEESKTDLISGCEKKENPMFYPPSENDDDSEAEHLNDEELLRKMNIEEIIGCRTDCTRISYDSGLDSEKNISDVDNIVKDHVIDKTVVMYDENNKENVGTESQCVNDVSTNRVPRKSSPEVRYFEPPSPNNDFTKFVKEFIRESEDVSLLNFSIELNYPEDYDVIFRTQLGATVKRVVKVDPCTPSSTSAVSSNAMETFSSLASEEILSNEGLGDEHKQKNKLNSVFSPTPGNDDCLCSSSPSDQVVASVQKINIANATKRKTLGIKRKLSNTSRGTVSKGLHSFKVLPNEYQTLAASRACDSLNVMGEDPAFIPTEEPAYLNAYTQEYSNSQDVIISLPNIAVDEKKRIYSSFNNNEAETSSYPVSAKPSKKLRKNSPVKSSDELSTDMGPKRTPYQNKCYYDSSDLYKPRPSFLASSRRSRTLNPDSK